MGPARASPHGSRAGIPSPHPAAGLSGCPGPIGSSRSSRALVRQAACRMSARTGDAESLDFLVRQIGHVIAGSWPREREYAWTSRWRARAVLAIFTREPQRTE